MAYSIAFAGDFDQDGTEDFVVSVPLYNRSTGLALIVLGGSFTEAIDIDTTTFKSGSRGMRVVSTTIRMLLGGSVGAAGDINQDGYADVLVGALISDNDKGAVYVIFGRPGPYADLSVSTMTAGASGFKITTDPLGGQFFGL
jgi:hypothetical protein